MPSGHHQSSPDWVEHAEGALLPLDPGAAVLPPEPRTLVPPPEPNPANICTEADSVLQHNQQLSATFYQNVDTVSISRLRWSSLNRIKKSLEIVEFGIMCRQEWKITCY